MSGNWITNQQVKIFMKTRSEGYTQEASAAKAGMSVKTARAIEQGKRQDPKQQPRHWRTREDPLIEVWDSQLVPMLRLSSDLKAITLLEWLQQQYPGQYEDRILRTLQRRVQQWRLLNGPEQEVIFRQEHKPGQLGLSDFTQLKRTTIMIAGQDFKHLLYHFRLIYSKWSYMKVITGGESYPALAEGMQEALQCLGGAPLNHRTDSLSAAFKNLSADEQMDMTKAYDALCRHYQMKASRNNPGRGHENGGVESAHGHLKRRIEQALLLRGNNNFASVTDYQLFIHDVVSQHNHRNAKTIDYERTLLQPLPSMKAVDYKLIQAVVTSSSTIDVRKVTYTVPSKLQGQTLQVRLYDNRLDCYLGCHQVVSLERIYPTGKTTRARSINYKHVIHSLVKKPQAFRYSQIREDLLPNTHYKEIWVHVDATMESKLACRFIVGLLHLAATQDCEQELAAVVLALIAEDRALSLTTLQEEFGAIPSATIGVSVKQHSLQAYNQLLCQPEVSHA